MIPNPLEDVEYFGREVLPIVRQLAITVPREYGGADLSAETLSEVMRLIAAGDPNVAQIPHSHFAYVNVLREQGTEFVATKSRPYPDAGVERAAEDPLVVQAFGELELQVRAAEALLAEAGRAVDRADA